MDYSAAMDRAAKLLNYSRMSCKELKEKLIRKGESEEAAEYCSERLEELGLLNDRQYALDVARHYSRKGYGEGKIKAELIRRGVPKEYFSEALDSVEDNSERIREFIIKKLKDPSDRSELQKISAALARRGFSISEIKSAIAAVTENFRED